MTDAQEACLKTKNVARKLRTNKPEPLRSESMFCHLDDEGNHAIQTPHEETLTQNDASKKKNTHRKIKFKEAEHKIVPIIIIREKDKWMDISKQLAIRGKIQ